MAARSTRVTVRNQTGKFLRHLDDSLDGGQWTEPLRPPPEILPSQTAWWQSESDGVATGTEGYVIAAKLAHKRLTLRRRPIDMLTRVQLTNR